jgi:hypothetical protein
LWPITGIFSDEWVHDRIHEPHARDIETNACTELIGFAERIPSGLDAGEYGPSDATVDGIDREVLKSTFRVAVNEAEAAA